MYSIKGKIIFEDGQGNVFDESGNEAMDWDEEVDPHNLESLTNLTGIYTKSKRIRTKLVQVSYRRSIKLFFLIILMSILQLELKMQLMALQKTSKTSP
jgi:hypothetical protein